MLNIFFANIDKELAAKIDPPLSGVSIHDFLENRKINSIFFSPINEKEIHLH